MNGAPLDALYGSPAFTIKTEKRDDGSFVGTVIGHPELTTEGTDELHVHRVLRTRIQEFVQKGFKQ